MLFAQGNGASCPESLKMYEEVLSQLCVPVTFTKDRAFVPSFFEDWIFYQVSPKWWSKGRSDKSWRTTPKQPPHSLLPLLWPKLLPSLALLINEISSWARRIKLSRWSNSFYNNNWLFARYPLLYFWENLFLRRAWEKTTVLEDESEVIDTDSRNSRNTLSHIMQSCLGMSRHSCLFERLRRIVLWQMQFSCGGLNETPSA